MGKVEELEEGELNEPCPFCEHGELIAHVAPDMKWLPPWPSLIDPRPLYMYHCAGCSVRFWVWDEDGKNQEVEKKIRAETKEKRDKLKEELKETHKKIQRPPLVTLKSLESFFNPTE